MVDINIKGGKEDKDHSGGDEIPIFINFYGAEMHKLILP